ncbi:MAG: hypothetical protein D3M94_16390 [Rhodocyclales bacterium GT-UBC]|nr:MAG: hypothetical protein D3M94_16390 [Rhodocyclales bacterium GT-UBC]
MPGAKLLAGLLAFGCASAHADRIVCHLNYGGMTQEIEARPSASPYLVAPSPVGTFFLFRIVWRDTPTDLAGIKLYTYANRDEGPAILHQASYPYPLPVERHDDFTGEQRIYEPIRDSELAYRCAFRQGTNQ